MGHEKSSKKYSTKNKLAVRMSAKKAKPGPKAHKSDMRMERNFKSGRKTSLVPVPTPRVPTPRPPSLPRARPQPPEKPSFSSFKNVAVTPKMESSRAWARSDWVNPRLLHKTHRVDENDISDEEYLSRDLNLSTSLGRHRRPLPVPVMSSAPLIETYESAVSRLLSTSLSTVTSRGGCLRAMTAAAEGVSRPTNLHRTSVAAAFFFRFCCAVSGIFFTLSTCISFGNSSIIVNFAFFTDESLDQPTSFSYTEADKLSVQTFTNFKPFKPVKILIADWNDRTGFTEIVKNAYLPETELNVAIVEWSSKSYDQALSDVSLVGRTVASLIDQLVVHFSSNATDVHIVGHRLGAHVAGSAGLFVKSGPVGRITGLEPLCFHPELNRDSAEFVDVIDSCGSLCLNEEQRGHADFYAIPLGGSHVRQRIFELYARTINDHRAYYSHRCSDIWLYLTGHCRGNPTELVGEPATSKCDGKYFFMVENED